jgi:hypothetical protein
MFTEGIRPAIQAIHYHALPRQVGLAIPKNGIFYNVQSQYFYWISYRLTYCLNLRFIAEICTGLQKI